MNIRRLKTIILGVSLPGLGMAGAQIPNVPLCRPGWLVEFEGLALKRERSEFPDFL